MKKVAFVPVRGGSQSIPLKNIKQIAGKPLVCWSIQAALDSQMFDQIVVATDSAEIKSLVLKSFSNLISVFDRSDENAQNHSSTESVMIEYLNQSALNSDDLFCLIQATNPFVTALDFRNGFQKLKTENSDSLLTAVISKRFFWNKNAQPLNYDFKNRPRRQDFAGWYMENGAFYISKVGDILKYKNRLSGKISILEMNEISGFEIDEPSDWTICEALLLDFQKGEFK